MKHTFTSIDFETAQGKRCSICQVGLVRVESGVITKEISFLVQPPDNYYWKWFTDDIHGISPEDTANEPTFDEVWHIMEPFITNQWLFVRLQCVEKTLGNYMMSQSTN